MPSQARCPVNLVEGEDPRSHDDVVCAMSGSALWTPKPSSRWWVRPRRVRRAAELGVTLLGPSGRIPGMPCPQRRESPGSAAPRSKTQLPVPVTLSVAAEAQVRRHMCWSSGFDPIEGLTLGSRLVPGGRTDRSREPSRARAVRRLGVPVGMGGKANCLCLRGIWETPKPRYREETKPVVELPGTTFVPEIHPVRIAYGGERMARRPRG